MSTSTLFDHRPRASREEFSERARARQRSLTKPEGSLGRLESLAIALAARSEDGAPCSRPAAVVLFASDHPVAQRGVSAYPPAVTAAMVANFLRGGAAASVLAAHLELPMLVVDVGVGSPYECPPPRDGVRLVRDAVADLPVGDLTIEDALPRPTLEAAILAGRRAVDALAPATRVVILGEMGIGNTTVAAAVAGALLGLEADAIVGSGTGVDDVTLAIKRKVVAQALARVPRGASVEAVLQAVGGREIAALASAAGAAVERGMVVLVDGFIVSVAMLALVRAVPSAREGLVFAHLSREEGHRRVLEALGGEPLLDLAMRLGEASGALTALPLLDAACAIHRSMATFADASVPDRADG